VLFYGEQKKFPQIGANPLFMGLAIPFIGTTFLLQHESLMLFFDINHNIAALSTLMIQLLEIFE